MKLHPIYKNILESAIPPDLPGQNIGTWQSTQTPVENPNPGPSEHQQNIPLVTDQWIDPSQLEGSHPGDIRQLSNPQLYQPIGQEDGKYLYLVVGTKYKYILAYDPSTKTWYIRSKVARISNAQSGAGGLSYVTDQSPKEGHGMFYNENTGKWELYRNPNDPNDRIDEFVRIRGKLYIFDKDVGDYVEATPGQIQDLERRQGEGEYPYEIPSHQWNPLVWGPYGFPRPPLWHRERRLNPWHFKDTYSRYNHESNIYGQFEKKPYREPKPGGWRMRNRDWD